MFSELKGNQSLKVIFKNNNKKKPLSTPPKQKSQDEAISMRVVNEFSNGKILYMFSYESKCSLSPKCLNHINLQDVFIFNFTKLLCMNVFASSDLVVFYENENEMKVNLF